MIRVPLAVAFALLAAPGLALGQAAPDAPAAPGATAAAAEPPLPQAEPIGFHSRADKARVRLGEPFGYTIEIRHRPEERYTLHGQPALSPFQADAPTCRRVLEKDKEEARTTCTMRLALFALGEVDVPELPFDVERPAGKARLAVPGPRVEGVGVIDPRADSVTLRDVAAPVPLLVRSWRLLWWALAILGAAVLAVLVVRALRRRGRRPAPEVTPFERFARRLASLEAERLPAHGQGTEHVARLSEAVREYLGALAGIPALDLTSAELVAALRAAAGAPQAPPAPPALDLLDLVGLERFLAEADLVKFARQPAGPERCAAATAYAKDLLERTRPSVPPEPGHTDGPGAASEGGPAGQARSA